MNKNISPFDNTAVKSYLYRYINDIGFIKLFIRQ